MFVKRLFEQREQILDMFAGKIGRSLRDNFLNQVEEAPGRRQSSGVEQPWVENEYRNGRFGVVYCPVKCQVIRQAQ